MMKTQNKKRGFTIIELVIVVSVIAILSAVLIPTFAGIIKKANMSADQQVAKQLTTQVKLDDEIKTFDQAMDAIAASGNQLKPVSEDHKYFWSEEYNTIVLVNTKEDKVVFPDDKNIKASYEADKNKFHDVEEGQKYIDIVASTQAELVSAFALGSEKISLANDIEITQAMYFAPNSNITLDLNGKKLDASKLIYRPFELQDGTNLTINAEGSEIVTGGYGLVNVPANATATVVLNGGTYTANTDNGAFLKVRSGATANFTLNNVTYTDSSANGFILNKQGAKEATLTINGGTYAAAYGFQATSVNAKDATITTSGYAFDIEAATESTISNCTITAGSLKDKAGLAHGAIVAAVGAKVEADNCTITVADGIVAYFVANSGGEIIATNAKGALTAGSTLPVINEGATIKITVNDEVKVNSEA